MSEIKGTNFNLNQVNFGSIQKHSDEVEPEAKEQEQLPQATDFSDPKAEALGRSMLFKGTDDNINNDLKALAENPQIAENSDKLFEAAYMAAQDAGAENPYETAASISTTAM